MGFLADKWKQVVYTFNSNDRYAGYSSPSRPIYKNSGSGATSDYINDSLIDYPEDGSTLDNVKDIFEGVSTSTGSQEVIESWKLIEEWLDQDPDSLQDLNESLSDPCTKLDLKESQKDLRTRFPKCVIQYFQIHDGQELSISSTRKHGLLFGLQLMTLDEVVTTSSHWRKVAEKESQPKASPKAVPKETEEESKALEEDPNFQIGAKLQKVSKKDMKNYPDLIRNMSKHSKTKYIRELPSQSSIPPDAIQNSYANPGWIPLVTDYSGNHIGVDVNPGPEGAIGQVIIFGREYDTKYVIASNWGEFLKGFVKDLQSKNAQISYNNEFDDYDLVFSGNNNYLDVLAKRAEAKWEAAKEAAAKSADDELINLNNEDGMLEVEVVEVEADKIASTASKGVNATAASAAASTTHKVEATTSANA